MTMRVPKAPQSPQITSPQLGTLSPAWQHFISELVRKIEELEARIAALETP